MSTAVVSEGPLKREGHGKSVAVSGVLFLPAREPQAWPQVGGAQVTWVQARLLLSCAQLH